MSDQVDQNAPTPHPVHTQCYRCDDTLPCMVVDVPTLQLPRFGAPHEFDPGRLPEMTPDYERRAFCRECSLADIDAYNAWRAYDGHPEPEVPLTHQEQLLDRLIQRQHAANRQAELLHEYQRQATGWWVDGETQFVADDSVPPDRMFYVNGRQIGRTVRHNAYNRTPRGLTQLINRTPQAEQVMQGHVIQEQTVYGDGTGHLAWDAADERWAAGALQHPVDFLCSGCQLPKQCMAVDVPVATPATEVAQRFERRYYCHNCAANADRGLYWEPWARWEAAANAVVDHYEAAGRLVPADIAQRLVADDAAPVHDTFTEPVFGRRDVPAQPRRARRPQPRQTHLPGCERRLPTAGLAADPPCTCADIAAYPTRPGGLDDLQPRRPLRRRTPPIQTHLPGCARRLGMLQLDEDPPCTCVGVAPEWVRGGYSARITNIGEPGVQARLAPLGNGEPVHTALCTRCGRTAPCTERRRSLLTPHVEYTGGTDPDPLVAVCVACLAVQAYSYADADTMYIYPTGYALPMHLDGALPAMAPGQDRWLMGHLRSPEQALAEIIARMTAADIQKQVKEAVGCRHNRCGQLNLRFDDASD